MSKCRTTVSHLGSRHTKDALMMQSVQIDDSHAGSYDERYLLAAELQVLLQTGAEQPRLAVGGRPAEPGPGGAAHGSRRPLLQLRRVLRQAGAEQFALHLETGEQPGVGDEISELLQSGRDGKAAGEIG